MFTQILRLSSPNSQRSSHRRKNCTLQKTIHDTRADSNAAEMEDQDKVHQG